MFNFEAFDSYVNIHTYVLMAKGHRRATQEEKLEYCSIRTQILRVTAFARTWYSSQDIARKQRRVDEIGCRLLRLVSFALAVARPRAGCAKNVLFFRSAFEACDRAGRG